MARIRVSHGWFGMGFMEALQKAKPQDVIVVGEGHYKVEPVFMNQLRVVGKGDPTKIILETQIEALGHLQLENLTIQAAHFRNAVKLLNNQARVELTDVYIHGDAAGKYPVVYSSGGTVVMKKCLVSVSGEKSHGVAIESYGSLLATNTTLPAVSLVASYAELDHVRASLVNASDGSKVIAPGNLYLNPPDGLRCLVLNNESVAQVGTLYGSEASFEVYVDESFLQLDNIQLEVDGPLPVYTKGTSTINAANDAVVLMDPDTKAPVASTPGGPKSVVWQQEDARRFRDAVLPLLHKGDTLLIDEGQYFLDDVDNVLSLDINIEGRGAAENIMLHGTVVRGTTGQHSVSNISICPVNGRNSVVVADDGSLTLTNVLVFPEASGELPAIHAEAGTLIMIDSAVKSETEHEFGMVQIVDDAHLAATRSLLGWASILRGASAHLQDSSAVSLSAGQTATVTGAGEFQLYSNSLDLDTIQITTGASVHLEQVHTEDEYIAFSVNEGSLKIQHASGPGHGVVRVEHAPSAQVYVAGETVVLHELEARPVQAAAPTSGPPTEGAAEGDHEESEESTEQTLESEASDADQDPLAQLNALVGLATVKQQIEDFTQLVEFNQRRLERGLKTTEQTMHSLFLGNPGTGKTTVARHLGQVLYNAGAIKNDTFIEVQRRDLVGEALGTSANMTQSVLERARGGVLFIDEAYSLYQRGNNEFAQEAVDTIITYMEDNRESTVIIFAGYPKQMQDFLNMNPGLKSRIPNRFDFKDYSEEEIVQIGYQSLLKADYRVSQDLYSRIVAAKYRQSSENSNGRWVRNFNEQLMKQMVRRVMDTDVEDTETITDDDLYALSGGSSEQKAENVEMLLYELDQLVGLESVKAWAHDLIDEVRANTRLASVQPTMDRPTYHMVFTGNPGTGKTTVAAIISKLFYNLGILETPTVKDVDRSSLVGSWIGHTEANTTRAIDEAMGGVLFVDEAYQLHVEQSPNDFGKMVIETFMTRLENDREKFVAIFAGYTDQMHDFLAANPGLRSRIPLTIEFPDYTPEEVAHIVCARLGRSWTFDESLVFSVAATEYAKLSNQEQSNGRWARNYAQHIEKQHKKWLIDHDVEGETALHIETELIASLATT